MREGSYLRQKVLLVNATGLGVDLNINQWSKRTDNTDPARVCKEEGGVREKKTLADNTTSLGQIYMTTHDHSQYTHSEQPTGDNMFMNQAATMRKTAPCRKLLTFGPCWETRPWLPPLGEPRPRRWRAAGFHAHAHGE